jgi:hypothetical protein
MRSSLLNALAATDLALDLFTGPACSIDGSGLEIAVLASFLDHLGEPVGTVVLGKLAVGESVGKITNGVSRNKDKIIGRRLTQ